MSRVHNDYIDVLLVTLMFICFLLSGLNEWFILGSVFSMIIFIIKIWLNLREKGKIMEFIFSIILFTLLGTMTIAQIG